MSMPENNLNSADTQDVTVDDSLSQSGAQPADDVTVDDSSSQTTNPTNTGGDDSVTDQTDSSTANTCSSDDTAVQADDNSIDSNSSTDTTEQSGGQCIDDNNDDSANTPDNQSTESSDDASGNQCVDNSSNSSASDDSAAAGNDNSAQTNNQQTDTPADIATWIGDDIPVRMLTVSQALQVVAFLIKQNNPALQIDGNKVDQANLTTMFTGNGLTQKIVKAYRIKPDVINGIQFKYLTTDTATKVIGFIDNADPRMIVFLYKFTNWLKNTWGPANAVTITEVHHIGIGHGNPDHLFDCHNTGRAMDLGGIAGTKSDGTPFTLSILNDWGKKPTIAVNGAQCFRLADTNGLIYNFARDFDAYAMQQCQDKSQNRDPRLSDTEPQQRMFVTGQPTAHSFIIHPDHPDAALRSAHQNHFHVQISTTGYEASPAL